MLSRVAERVYWQSRYLERAESTARFLSVISTLIMDLPKGTKIGWHTLIEITEAQADFDATKKKPTERQVMDFLMGDKNSHSLVFMLAMARENARTTREIMPTEAFEQINNLYYFAKENTASATSRTARHLLLEGIINRCQQLTGILDGSLSRSSAYSFVQLGRNLERADMTTRVVDVGSRNLLPDINPVENVPEASEPYENIQWMNVLRSQSAYQMYRQHVKERINAEDVVEFLLQDPELPRSVLHSLAEVKKVCAKLPRGSKAVWHANRASKTVRDANIEKLLYDGLFDYIDLVQLRIATIHEKIANTWFLPPAE